MRSPPSILAPARGALLRGLVSLALLVIGTTLAPAASTTERRAPFDIAAAPALESFKKFAEQATVQLLYASDLVSGVTTNAVRGEFTPREAIERMLAGTALSAHQAANGAIAVRRSASDPNAKRAAQVMTRDRPDANRTADDVGAPLELSPFVISSSTEAGWVATETLAGSRLRTNFKDVPNQIETLTRDFMEDLAVTSIEQALIYTANVENQNEYLQNTAGLAVNFPTRGGRVRGIGSGTLTRNFFQVHNPTDNFNLDRATVASGPNAILFGLGSPAGILDATPARALMRNKYGFVVQFDSEESKRATFDANVVVVPQKLAFRLMGLSKHEYTDRQPNVDRDDRLYGAITFTPFKNTTLILQGERDKRNWNRAGRIAPTDFVTPWLTAQQIPGSGYSVARPIYDNRNLTGIASNVIFTQAGENPVILQDGTVPIRSWLNSVSVKGPGSMPGVDQTFDAGGGYTILDPSIFPFDVNIIGSARTVKLGAYTKTAIIEQKITRNLFVELGYNREDAYDHRLAAGGQSSGYEYRLNVDPNQYIPGTTTPNPHAGQFYYQGNAANDLEFDKRDEWRATISYELDAARKLGARSRVAKWLGRHRFSGLYTGSKARMLNQMSFDRRILDDPVIPGVTLRAKNQRNWAIHASRIPQFRHYLNDPGAAMNAFGSMTGNWSLPDVSGSPYTLYGLDTPLRSTDGKRLAAGQVASGSLTETNAFVFAWQGFFLPDRQQQDRLVLTYGYRKDSAKSANLDQPSITQDFSGLFPALWDVDFAPFGQTQSGINRNIGIVARPLRWLSVFYNASTTFDLNIGRYDPFGNEIHGASGDGRDYGLRFDLWDDRLTLRINKYFNSLGPQRASNQINSNRDIYFNLEQRVLELDPALPTINTRDGNMHGYRVAGRPNYYITSDSESEGYEVELNFTPTRNWNIRLNGAKSESVESNIGQPWFAWGNARLPVWQSVVAKNGEADAAGRPVTWATAPLSASAPTGQTLQQYYETALLGRAQAFMSAADGRAVDTARGARANLITNYRFTDSRLRGFNFGGAFRWRAAPTIGYGVTRSSGGETVLDLDKAYEGEPEFYVDAILGYRGKLARFGGANYRVQLNVRNLLDKDDPVPVGALTTGAISRLAVVEPRVLVLTFAVEF